MDLNLNSIIHLLVYALLIFSFIQVKIIEINANIFFRILKDHFFFKKSISEPELFN